MLKFDDMWYLDEAVREMDSMYISSAPGDSGMGYFRLENTSPPTGEARFTILAVHYGKMYCRNGKCSPTEQQCVSAASKVTEPVIEWVEKIDSSDKY